VRELDITLFDWFYGRGGTPVSLAVMLALSFVGSGWTMLGVVPFLGWRRSRRFAGGLLATLSVAGVAVFGLKSLFQRVRPCHALGIPSLDGGTPTDFSFPSGHSTGAFCFAAFVATVLWLRYRRHPRAMVTSVALISIAGGIAASRVYLGVHFPFDVAAGAILGTAIGASGALVFEKKFSEALVRA
jgi:undecaprenyl-diphosphatase